MVLLDEVCHLKDIPQVPSALVFNSLLMAWNFTKKARPVSWPVSARILPSSGIKSSDHLPDFF